MTGRKGYVLLMVLVLLVVLSTVLTSLATQSMKTTQEAVIAVSQLQQRVGIASCRNTFLERAFFTFKDLDKRRLNGKLASSMESSFMLTESIVLGEQRFDLILSDENAKVNLNTTYFHTGPEKTERMVRRAIPTRVSRSVAFQPARNANRSIALPSQEMTESDSSSEVPQSKPSNSGVAQKMREPADAKDPAMIPAFRSWGEVFNFPSLVEQSFLGNPSLDFAKTFTLWGSGQINVVRASDASVLTQMEAVVAAGTAKKLLKAIRNTQDFNIRAIIERNVANMRQRQRLQALVGKDSFAFSLFVNVDAPQARSQKLFIVAPDENGTQQIQEFAFH